MIKSKIPSKFACIIKKGVEFIVDLNIEQIDEISLFGSSRRNRKLRYREPRFLNRTKSKHPGWLAPSVRAKVDSHLKVIEDMTKILPISKIIIETASFDLQKIKAMELGLPTPEGTDYQKGELLDFVNVREYVFWRDNYTCQWCHGKSKSNILHTHHWAYWKGDHTW